MRVAAHAGASPGWDAAVARLPEADVYHLAGYHRVAEANGEGEAIAFVAEADGNLFFHPFLRRPLERVGDEVVRAGLSDTESIYGYSGPLATTEDPSFLAAAWSAFHDWCVQEQVVAEFVRFNPLLANERFADAGLDVGVERETVALALPEQHDDLWDEYPSVQRNMVRKALAAGLEAHVLPVSDGLDSFAAVYAETMDRVGAKNYYRFRAAYFDALAAELGEVARIVVVSRGEEIAASCVLLWRARKLHYHLSGSRRWAAPLGATNLMLHEAACWGCSEGARVFHLGGGRTSAPDDSLLRFKQSVSQSRLVFRTGRRVHDPKVYEELCGAWLRQATGPRPPYFLLYRVPLS